MTREIHLTKQLPAAWVEENLLQSRVWLDHRHYDQVFSREPVDVYKPDGSPLLMLRPCALAKYVKVLPDLRTLQAQYYSEHRGLHSATIGYFEKPTCRLTKLTREHLREWRNVQSFVRECDEVFRQHDDQLKGRYSNQLAVAKQNEHHIGNTAFSTLTLNLNARTYVHTDSGDLEAGFGVISVLSKGDYMGGYLIFPSYRVAVDLRSTDLLLADVHSPHGNGPIVGNGPWSRLSCVCYFRERIQHCARSTGPI